MKPGELLSDKQIIDVLNLTKVATAIHITEDAIIQTANKAMLDVWGKDESVIGKTLEDALPELKGQPFIDMFRRVWNEGITLSGTDTPADLIIDGKLQTFYFNFEYRAVKNDLGETICILHTATDITESYHARMREQKLMSELANSNEELAAINEEMAATNEELTVANEELLNSQNKLTDTNDELRQNKDQLSFTINSAGLGTWDLDPKTGKLKGNSRLKGWFGLEPDDEVDLSSATNNIVERDRERVIAAINRAMTFSSGGFYDVEYEIINPKTGKRRYVRAKGKAEFDSQKEPIRLSGILQDITDQKKREQYKDDFISIASHELKTPVTTLKASLQMLERIKKDPQAESFNKLIEQANRSVEKTSSLIEDLLNASKLNTGQLQLEKRKFVLAELLENCCNHIRIEGKYDLIVEGDKSLEVYADEHRLDQVIVNMVNNAVKYAPNSRSIYLMVEKDDDMAKVSVTDEGPGISADKVGRLFDRYYRSDSSGPQFSGLGLGLYISSEIVKKHGGNIGVDSEIGKGSTFWFTIPLK